MIKPFCEDVAAFLKGSQQGVVAIHCKAGKGRTGALICAFLCHIGAHPDAESSLIAYGRARTANGKGVTIPSQVRYVRYYDKLLKEGGELGTPELQVRRGLRPHTTHQNSRTFFLYATVYASGFTSLPPCGLVFKTNTPVALVAHYSWLACD